MLWLALSAVGAVLILLAAMVAWQVDDWGRDLAQNHAATSDTAADEELRPVVASLPPPDATMVVEKAARELPHWTLKGNSSGADVTTLTFVRTTPWLKFKDDITVRVERHDVDSVIHAESRSRIGKGDLGQNPRNLKELLRSVRARLAER